jgi:hypothetical protein
MKIKINSVGEDPSELEKVYQLLERSGWKRISICDATIYGDITIHEISLLMEKQNPEVTNNQSENQVKIVP